MLETWGQSLGQEDPLQEEMATHSSILTWEISRTEEPGRLQSVGKYRVRQGVVIDQAIHSIDLVRWIIDDEVESVSCSMANRRHKIVDVEDSAEGFITFKNGTTYGFWCMNNYSCDEPIEIRLNCERGKVVFGYNEALIQYKDGTVEEVKKAPQSFKGKDYWGNWHVRQLSNFYRACLDLEPLEIDGEEALKTHKLICRIYDEGGMKK